MKIITLLLLSIMPIEALANTKISIERSFFTRHARRQDWMNEDNNLIGIELMRGDYGVNISKFNNTYGNDTQTIGAIYNLARHKHIEFDVMFGAVKGYTKEQIKTVCRNGWCAYISPRLTLKRDIAHGFGIKTSVQLFGSATVGTVGITYEF